MIVAIDTEFASLFKHFSIAILKQQEHYFSNFVSEKQLLVKNKSDISDCHPFIVN